MATALLIIDYQNDFARPDGALSVPGGEDVAETLNRLAGEGDFDFVVATRDWHPPDHGSFEGVEVSEQEWKGISGPNTWPVHCVAGTEGAELHPALDTEQVDVILDKGQDRHTEGYSAFQGTGLEEMLRKRGIDEVAVGGLATDVCVRASTLDALEAGFDATVIEDASRGVDKEPGDTERAIREMTDAGARVESSDALLDQAQR